MTTSETFRAIRSESAQIRLLTTLLQNNELTIEAMGSLILQRQHAHVRRGKLRRLLCPEIIPMEHEELWRAAARRAARPLPPPDLPA